MSLLSVMMVFKVMATIQSTKIWYIFAVLNRLKNTKLSTINGFMLAYLFFMPLILSFFWMLFIGLWEPFYVVCIMVYEVFIEICIYYLKSNPWNLRNQSSVQKILPSYKNISFLSTHMSELQIGLPTLKS